MSGNAASMMMTMGRRAVLRGGVALGAVLVLGLAGVAPAWADDSGSIAFVKGFGDRLAAIVNGPQAEEVKKQALVPVIDANVDVAAIAHFCLGRFWRGASAAQQTRFVAVYHRVMLNKINDHLGAYVGVSFAMGGSRPQGDTVIVGTTITRPNKAPAEVGWVVSNATGTPKVVDLVAEGTSQRLQQRDDYASFLRQHGNDVDALIAALERQVGGG